MIFDRGKSKGKKSHESLQLKTDLNTHFKKIISVLSCNSNSSTDQGR